METEMMTVEINGVKMEVDMRHAKVVHENIKVGSRVKLLAKGSSYAGPSVYAGVVVGFEPFKDLPTIVVAYVSNGYGETEFIKFAYINPSKESVDKWDMIPSLDDDLPVRKGSILDGIDREIVKHQQEIIALKHKRVYFLSNFGAYFVPAEVQDANA